MVPLYWSRFICARRVPIPSAPGVLRPRRHKSSWRGGRTGVRIATLPAEARNDGSGRCWSRYIGLVLSLPGRYRCPLRPVFCGQGAINRHGEGRDGRTDCRNPVCALGFAMTEVGGVGPVYIGLVLSLPGGSRYPLRPVFCGQRANYCHCEEAEGRRGNPYPPQPSSPFMPAANF